jgi:hypothetical protein
VTEVGGVESLVRDRIDEFEVFDSVVLLIAVSVVDLEAFWDRASLSFPDEIVDESLSLAGGIPSSVISLGGRVSEAA